MSIVVFLGPSLGVDDAKRVLDAIFLPPCKMGDVFAAAESRPRAIGIIDGHFEQTPAVWHKEILYAMSLGIKVFGGASMGALRAAELHTFGMIGIGKVFEDYANGVLEDDDEVAVLHLPEDGAFLCHSDAMVNIRHGLERAVEAGVIAERTKNMLLWKAKQAHYSSRSWHSLYDVAPRIGIQEQETHALKTFIESHRPDRKRDDAIAVLQAIAEWSRRGAGDPLKRTDGADVFKFEPTIFWEHLCRYFGASTVGNAHSDSVPLQRVIHHVRLTGPERERVRERALLLFLTDQEAKRLELKPADARRALERFRHERGLKTPELLAAWLARERVSKEECIELARLEDTVRSIEWRYSEQVNKLLATVLKLEGKYGGTVECVEHKWRLLRRRGIAMPTEENVGSIEAVLDWYQKIYGTIHCDLTQHIVELGFGSPRQFLSELIAEYLHTTSPQFTATVSGIEC